MVVISPYSRISAPFNANFVKNSEKGPREAKSKTAYKRFCRR